MVLLGGRLNQKTRWQGQPLPRGTALVAQFGWLLMIGAIYSPPAPLYNRKSNTVLINCYAKSPGHWSELLWVNSPTPEISLSFSSCMAREVWVMSIDDVDTSSLSNKSAASGIIAGKSVSEKPEKTSTQSAPVRLMVVIFKHCISQLTRVHDSLDGWR